MRLKFLSIIDYIWYAGERFHQQEKSPGDGTMLVAICWYGSFFLPLLSLIYRLKIPQIVQIILSAVLVVIPFVLCRIRYNNRNRRVIELRYKSKKRWGNRLLAIWAVLITVVIVEFIVSVKTGLWHIGE